MRKIYFDKARKLSHTAAILMIMIAVVMVIAGVTVYAEGETGIKLDKKTLNLEIGETVKLEATITPEGGNLDDVKWSSSSEKVATVKKGEVTCYYSRKVTTGSAPTYTFYDAAGKELRTVSHGLTEKHIVYKDTRYDKMGRVETESLPYFKKKNPQQIISKAHSPTARKIGRARFWRLTEGRCFWMKFSPRP